MQAVLLFTVIVLVGLGYCHGNSDEVSMKARQYNCPYYYKNSGPSVTGLGPWLLVGLSIAALLISTGSSYNTSVSTRKSLQ